MQLFDVYPLYNITPEKAEGSWIWDNKGVRYLDLYGGHAVISIGHSHPHYINSIEKQVRLMGFYSNAVQIPQQTQLAQKLGEISGYTNYNLFLCNSGAEANENALKLASFHNNRKNIIAFRDAFHGRTSLAVACTDDLKINAAVNENKHIQFLPFNDISALQQAVNEDTCAVIIEGIQGVGGIQVATPEFLKAAERLCKQSGALLILDEIQSGYGRSGKFFAHQHAEIQPHLITIAKGMGNGFPVAGVLIHPDIKAKHGMLGTTFGGNHLASAAAQAVLEVMEKQRLIQRATEMGNYFLQQLATVEGIKEVRGAGLMIGIETDGPMDTIRKNLLFKHHIFTGASSGKNTIRLLPALTVSKIEIDIFIKALKEELVSTTSLNNSLSSTI